MTLGGLRVFALFAAVALAFVALFAVMGPPIGHSALWDMAWARGFSAQFLSGELYPRWIHSLNGGAGSPVFFFYGPLPFWVQAATGDLLCRSCDPFSSHMIGPSLLLGLSGFAFYLWARVHAAAPAAIAAALLYVLLPYHLEIDLFRRMALGEFAAYLWMPLILLGLARAEASSLRGVVANLLLATAGYAGLILSHLPSALLFSGAMAVFAAIRFGPLDGARKLVLPVVLGVGLAGVYLLPALTTQDLIDADWWSGHYDARNWLWLDGREAPSRFADIVLPSLLAPTLIAVGLALAIWAKDRRASPVMLFVVVTLAGCWFLMTVPSAPLWEHVEVLRKVQFPWRLGIVIDFCAATMAAVWLQRALRRDGLWRLSVTAGVLLLAIYYAAAAGPMGALLLRTQDAETEERVARLIERGYDAPEYRPAWSREAVPADDFQALTKALDALPEAALVSGVGTVAARAGDRGSLLIGVDAQTPVRLRLKRFYYPGWRLADSDSGAAFDLGASVRLGLIEAKLPAGGHNLVLARTPLPEQSAGVAVSSTSLLACLLLAAWSLSRGRNGNGNGRGKGPPAPGGQASA